jgi:hypothetical protein
MMYQTPESAGFTERARRWHGDAASVTTALHKVGLSLDFKIIPL